MNMDMLHGHGHAACTVDMYHGNGNAAWLWTCNVDMDMHHGKGHAEWTWTSTIISGEMTTDIKTHQFFVKDKFFMCFHMQGNFS
jgi:hypothetical protein